jgi:hypothetical protein
MNAIGARKALRPPEARRVMSRRIVTFTREARYIKKGRGHLEVKNQKGEFVHISEVTKHNIIPVGVFEVYGGALVCLFGIAVFPSNPPSKEIGAHLTPSEKKMVR